jgi:hypothetical protein
VPLIWLTVVKKKKPPLPTVFQRFLVLQFSKVLIGAEPFLRLLIVHSDIRGLVTVRSFFVAELPTIYKREFSTKALSDRGIEDSPDRGCAPMRTLEACFIAV